MADYKQRKLGNVIFTKYLAKKLEGKPSRAEIYSFVFDANSSVSLQSGTNVITTSLHPGVVRTEIMRDVFNKTSVFSIILQILKPLLFVIAKNCEEGAQTTLHCALDDEEVPKYNGEYFRYERLLEPSGLVLEKPSHNC